MDDELGVCADCGEDAAIVRCADELSRCHTCAIWMAYCWSCGAPQAIIDDDLWDSGLCAACRKASEE